MGPWISSQMLYQQSSFLPVYTPVRDELNSIVTVRIPSQVLDRFEYQRQVAQLEDHN